jgi:homoserine O-acetyltransferase
MKKKGKSAIIFIAILLIGCPNILFAYDQLVVKKVFELKEYITVAGQKIAPVRVGYETYGNLNQNKDNVILVCHHFSGTSHAAGKYSAAEVTPGYWDALIGSGKPFDTDKYFIISTDTISNLNVKDPMVITTGPASINPSTGKPYGMSFPLVTIRDFVRVQYELVKSLGIKKLKCVAGASMGGIQSLEWAVTYPDFVEKVIPVVATPRAYAWTIAGVKLWAEAVMLDPKWNEGDYYGKEEPIDGVAYSLKIITLMARSPWWADRAFDRKLADPAKNPYSAMENKYLVEDALDKAGLARAKVADANSLIYLAKANELHDIGFGYGSYNEALKRIKSRVLMVPSSTDILIYSYNSRDFVEALKKAGGNASLFEIPTWEGHIGGLTDIQKAGIKIKSFLAE